MAGTTSTSGLAGSSSRWIAHNAPSACSASTRRRGRNRASCRHSSAPIDPPAPVTSTVRSRTSCLDRGGVELDGFASQQVLDPDGAQPRELDLAADQLVDAGDDLRLDADGRQRSTRSRTIGPVASEMAMMA
jgi:hypothetical protein